MKKILIINLRRLGDVYSTAHLINSLTLSEQTEITLLTYKESEKAAKNLNNVKNIITIDRQELITITTNKLFTGAFALERFVNSLKCVKDEQWDSIVNFSNDSVGSYICSYLQSSTESTVGIHFNENRNIVTSSMWEIIFNDVLTNVVCSPMHFIDCYHRMLHIPYCENGKKLITNPEHDQTAAENIMQIRAEFSDGNPNNKIIGIQLATSSETKNIPESVLIDFIKLIRQSNEFTPLLFIAPTNQERQLANDINQNFSEELIVVEADLSAVTSVLMNIDLLVTPDTAIKHIADLVHCPVLEVALGEAPFLKQGTYNTGNLVLTNSITYENQKATKVAVTGADIFASAIYYFSKTKKIRPVLSNNVTLYKCNKDNVGATYVPVSGTLDKRSEINRLMSRQFISALLDNSESREMYNEIISLGTTEALAWCSLEKNVITEVMKDLLGTLRSLLQSLENKRSSREFIINLSKLISHCDTNSSTQIGVIIFKTKIEAINARSFEENTKEVELLLYELKSYLQKNLGCIKQLEDVLSAYKKEEMLQRVSHSQAQG